MTTKATWRDLNTDGPGDPDALVEVDGHVLYAYDEEKLARVVERARSLETTSIVVSPDIGYMLAPIDHPSLVDLGLTLTTDESLPDETVVAA